MIFRRLFGTAVHAAALLGAMAVGLSAEGGITVDPDGVGATDVSPDPTGQPDPVGIIGPLTVGDTGAGDLQIDGGSVINSTDGDVAGESGSTGRVVIADPGSAWKMSAFFNLGRRGDGEVWVENGGTLTSTTAYIATNGTGQITVDGVGSTWTNTGTYMSVGYNDLGQLNITNGGRVTSGYSSSGTGNQALGQMWVTGAGSIWEVTDELRIGYLGTAELTVAAGGAVTAQRTTAGWSQSETPPTPSSLTVTGPGSSLHNADALFVGVYSDASLTVAAGGTVTDTFGSDLGFYESSTGTATVTGAGSSLMSSSVVNVGFFGSGVLHITDGGEVSDTTAFIGREAGSTGVGVLSGADSTWTQQDWLFVGYLGEGELTVEDGGTAVGRIGIVASEEGSVGEATVTGDGSAWHTEEDLTVGRFGQGELHVEAGGEVTSDRGRIGTESGAAGTVVVTGTGSAWRNTSSLAVGGTGQSLRAGSTGVGTLRIEDGGEVSAVSATVGPSRGSNGRVEVRDEGSDLLIDTDLFVGFSGDAALALESGGRVEVGQTMTVGATGQVDLIGGTIRAATVNHQAGGQFAFTGGRLDVGVFDGELTQGGGQLDPGKATIATAQVTGDYVFTDGELVIEVGNAVGGGLQAEHDVLMVDGQAALAGGGLRVQLLDDWQPTLGDSLTFLTAAGGVSGVFDDASGLDLEGGLRFAIDYLPGAVVLRVEHDRLVGDLNADGFVSQADLDLVLLNWGESVLPPTWASAPGFDGLVSQNELDDILLNWGDGVGPGVRSVPEPAAMLLMWMVVWWGRKAANPRSARL